MARSPASSTSWARAQAGAARPRGSRPRPSFCCARGTSRRCSPPGCTNSSKRSWWRTTAWGTPSPSSSHSDMRIRVQHATTYEYDQPAAGVIQALRVTPSEHEAQDVLSWRVDVDVDGLMRVTRDAFGNVLNLFYA